MSINVTGPGGVSVSFPDGTDPTTIHSVMSQHFGGAPAPGPAAPPVNFDRADPRFTPEAMASEKALEGVPILGGLVPKAGAAVSALAQPLTGVGAEGGSFSERYGKNLAQENSASETADFEHPGATAAAKFVGGTAATLPLASTAMGARLLGLTGTTLPGQIARGALSGATVGGADAATRGGDIAQGAVTGASFGGGLPVVGKAVGAVAAPLASSIMARFNPEGAAEGLFARAAVDSGVRPRTLTTRITTAAREGQGEYTAADAMGHSGQRLLSTVAGAPGPGRQAAIDFLDTRQAGQGRRLSNILSEGMEAPQTMEQARTSMTAARDANANIDYGMARMHTGAVDVSPAIQQIDSVLQPGVTKLLSPQTNIADNSIEATLRRARSMLTDGNSQLTDFNAVFMAKKEIDNLIDNGTKTQQAFLIPVKNALDNQLAAASPVYRQARDTFRQRSQAIEALDAGKTAALRGRTEDTIPAFNAMTPEQQAAHRIGYVDPLIEQVQGGPIGVNKARPFTADAPQAELRAMAPAANADQMMNRLGREQTMFETRAKATGGSRTAENLEDNAAARIDPSFLGAMMAGHYPAAVANLARNTANNLFSGYTPAVREHLADLLLARGTRPNIRGTIDRVADRIELRRRILNAALASSGRVGTAEMNGGPAQPQ